jgi:hypothetical protein
METAAKTIPAQAQAKDDVAATLPKKELYPTNQARRLRYLGGPSRCVQKYKPPLFTTSQ